MKALASDRFVTFHYLLSMTDNTKKILLSLFFKLRDFFLPSHTLIFGTLSYFVLVFFYFVRFQKNPHKRTFFFFKERTMDKTIMLDEYTKNLLHEDTTISQFINPVDVQEICQKCQYFSSPGFWLVKK